MEDVTDTVFRQIIIQCGRPDLFFTEFTNVEGMSSKGDSIVSQRLLFSSVEKPIIAQIWGREPENYYSAAKRIKEMGFDGIDINMGCPKKQEVQNGTCAALITNPKRASEIIHATQDGASGLPVSVKTRIGFNTIITEEWISFLLTHNVSAITVHGRTASELSLVPAHWDEIGKAVTLRNKMGSSTKIIGNGDVATIEEADAKVTQYGVDGVMIGRGIFHNPFLFGGIPKEQVTQQQLMNTLLAHLKLYESVWDQRKPYQILKKYFKIYVNGFAGAAEIREELMKTNTYKEALQVLSANTKC